MMQTYPLQWPPSWPRTKFPESSRFGDLTIARGKNEILEELRKMKATDVVISANLVLRIDGLPKSNQRQPDDCGVTVYFKLKGNDQCIPCDRWTLVEDNMRAIAKTVDALRGIGRWGADRMVDAAFTGFKALPEFKGQWWEVLGVPANASYEVAKKAYRELAFVHHTDQGGTQEKIAEINRAWQSAQICGF